MPPSTALVPSHILQLVPLLSSHVRRRASLPSTVYSTLCVDQGEKSTPPPPLPTMPPLTSSPPPFSFLFCRFFRARGGTSLRLAAFSLLSVKLLSLSLSLSPSLRDQQQRAATRANQKYNISDNKARDTTKVKMRGTQISSLSLAVSFSRSRFLSLSLSLSRCRALSRSFLCWGISLRSPALLPSTDLLALSSA